MKRFLVKFMLFIFLVGDLFLLISLLQVFLYTLFNPPVTPLMLQRKHEGDGLHYSWTPLEDISPYLQQAVMAAEDQRFMEHHGFDIVEIQNAYDHFQSGQKLRGASTISMQVARNLYLWQGRNWLRKGLEAYYTVLIEFFMPKWRIMELYLNIAEWGKGVFGAEEASLYHFSSKANDLRPDQAAFLAAILPSPKRWSAARPTEYIQQRQMTILSQMHIFRPLNKHEEKKEGKQP